MGTAANAHIMEKGRQTEARNPEPSTGHRTSTASPCGLQVGILLTLTELCTEGAQRNEMVTHRTWSIHICGAQAVKNHSASRAYLELCMLRKKTLN